MAHGLIEPLPLWLAQTNAWFVAPQGPGGECILRAESSAARKGFAASRH